MTIDWWTLGFQAVNVVVLVWLLQHFFWRPVAAMIELRRSTTEKALAEAKAAQDKATAALDAVAATRAGFAREHDAILAAAHTEAEAAAQTTRDAAATDAAAQTVAAHADIAAAHDAEEAAWTMHAGTLAVQIAGRLAGRLQGPAIDDAFLDWLVASIHAMPEADRRAALADTGGFEAVSAEPLAQDEQDRTRSRVAEAFGGQPRMSFRADPELIAGIELHGPHFILDNSWRADLQRIRSGMLLPLPVRLPLP